MQITWLRRVRRAIVTRILKLLTWTTRDRRIESCIQRYRARRKFDNDRKDVFDKYLSLGGIDTGPKAFSGGMDQARMSSMDAEQIHAATAIDSIGADKGGGAWAVDFEGVVKCFL